MLLILFLPFHEVACSVEVHKRLLCRALNLLWFFERLPASDHASSCFGGTAVEYTNVSLGYNQPLRCGKPISFWVSVTFWPAPPTRALDQTCVVSRCILPRATTRIGRRLNTKKRFFFAATTDRDKPLPKDTDLDSYFKTVLAGRSAKLEVHLVDVSHIVAKMRVNFHGCVSLLHVKFWWVLDRAGRASRANQCDFARRVRARILASVLLNR